jgi:membrane-anchored protein YejM (alkaline phosphatase superfamily)
MPKTFTFSSKASVYKNHWSLSNSTRFGLFSFFYGLPPTYWFEMLNEQRGAVLFDVLKDKSYSFHIDGAAKLNSPEFDRTIFSEVRDVLQWGEQGSEFEKDTAVINRLLYFLDQQQGSDKPFFSFTFLDAPHSYKLPKGTSPRFQPAIKTVQYMALNNDYDPEPFFNLYKSSVNYTDTLFARVYDRLEAHQMLHNTVVIISSDHGQEFNDLKQNYWGHNSNFSEHQLKVPLVIYWPGKKPSIITELSSHEDIAATVLTEGLGCANNPTDYSTGRSLLSASYQANLPLVFANWSSKAIFNENLYYNFLSTGGMEVLDKQYKKVEQKNIDPNLLKKALNKSKAFLK